MVVLQQFQCKHEWLLKIIMTAILWIDIKQNCKFKTQVHVVKCIVAGIRNSLLFMNEGYHAQMNEGKEIV